MLTTDQIHDMTSPEIYAALFDGRLPSEPVSMPEPVALAIIEHPAYALLDRNLVDWAWASVDEGD